MIRSSKASIEQSQENSEPLERHRLINLKQKLNTFVKSNKLSHLFGKEDIYLDQNLNDIINRSVSIVHGISIFLFAFIYLFNSSEEILKMKYFIYF